MHYLIEECILVTYTFLTMNKFSSILFNNKINVYTDDIQKAKELIQIGENTILSIFTSREYYRVFKNLTKVNKLTEHWGYENCNNYNDSFEANKAYYKQYLSKEDFNNFSEFNKVLNTENSRANNSLNINFIQTQKLSTFSSIVNKNKTGICFILNTKKIKTFNRDLYELLFCIPAKFSVSCNKEKSIAVINCEHEGWDKKNSFKQYTFTDDFFK